MKLRSATCILIALAFAFTFTGCKTRTAPEINTMAPGYHKATELIQGGTLHDIGDLNAKSLSVSTHVKDSITETELEFTFISGSRMSGSIEETAVSGIPEYSVYAFEEPARLVIEFENLAYWDYRHGLDLRDPLFRGTFQHTFNNSPKLSIYFQLNQPVHFAVEESENKLNIRLLPQTKEEQTLYYVTANAFTEYCVSPDLAEFDAYPTLSSNLQDILLISSAFPSPEEAEVYLNKALLQFPSLPVERWRVVSLTGMDLPEYDHSLDYLNAYNTPAVRLQSGEEQVLPVLVPDGLFLCDIPNGEGIMYSRELPTEGEKGYQQLWLMHNNGSKTLATVFEFEGIDQAQYSPDGRKLAVLERASGGSHLYVFDADTYELLNDLSGMGFGSNTGAFTWNSLGNTIYAIAGDSGMQLHQFDYSIPNEASRHSIVDNNSMEEESLGFCNGELYFSHATMEHGSTIYRIKPEGGVRKPFTKGNSFSVSSDARYLAILNVSEVTQETTQLAAFVLYELEKNNTTVITNDFTPYSSFWSLDCEKLYYIENRISEGQTELNEDEQAAEPETQIEAEADPYPYSLWVYDIKSATNKKLLDLSAPNIYPSNEGNVLYLNRYEANEAGTIIRATYLLELGALLG